MGFFGFFAALYFVVLQVGGVFGVFGVFTASYDTNSQNDKVWSRKIPKTQPTRSEQGVTARQYSKNNYTDNSLQMF